MSEIEIRTPGEDEFTRFGEAVSTAFSEQLRDEELELARKIVDPSRDLAAYEAGVIVGTASSYSLSLKVPGGDVKAAGVSAVGVAPTHRRRGIMSSLMRRLHDEAHGRGEPVAVLWAAEAPIYGRFGYGLGTINGRIDADRDRTMAGLQGDTSGSVRLVSKEEALDVLPSVYDRVRASTPGFIARDRIWWEVQRLADLEHWRNGSGPQFRAVLEREGRPEGYALYRLEHSWPEGFPGGTLHIQELLAADAAGWRDVWRFVFGIDLVARVKARSVAADDPIFLLAPEQARLRFRLGDGLWVRILDVPTALEGCDLLVIETMFSLDEARAAVLGCRDSTSLPIVVSFSFDAGAAEARTMMGHTVEEVLLAMAELGVDGIGLNCGKSLETARATAEEFVVQMRAHGLDLPLWVKPNAGLPEPLSGRYPAEPDDMASFAVWAAGLGAAVVGGCCGTTGAHLHEISTKLG